MATQAKPGQPRNKDKKNRNKKQGHDEATCSHCKKNPEDCWFKNPDKAPEWWRQKQDKNKNKNKNKSEESDSKSDSRSPNYYIGMPNEPVLFTQPNTSK